MGSKLWYLCFFLLGARLGVFFSTALTTCVRVGGRALRYRELIGSLHWRSFLRSLWKHYGTVSVGACVVIVTLPALTEILLGGIWERPALTLCLCILLLLLGNEGQAQAHNLRQQEFDAMARGAGEFYLRARNPSVCIEVQSNEHWHDFSISQFEVQHLLQQIGFPEVLQVLILHMYQEEFVCHCWLEIPALRREDPNEILILLFDAKNVNRILLFASAMEDPRRRQQI